MQHHFFLPRSKPCKQPSAPLHVLHQLRASFSPPLNHIGHDHETYCISHTHSFSQRSMDNFGPYIYCQSGTFGLASYHLSGAECYIDYSAAPISWVLDNGCRPPARKYFTDVKYDANTRTFRGIIDWSDSETNTTWDGCAQWWYRMVFSEDFTYILKGEVLSFDSSGNKIRTYVFGHDLHYALWTS